MGIGWLGFDGTIGTNGRWIGTEKVSQWISWAIGERWEHPSRTRQMDDGDDTWGRMNE